MHNYPVHLVTFRIEYLGFQSDLWCNTCRLGTGARLYWVTTQAGVMRIRNESLCVECGGHDIEAAPFNVDDGSADI